MAQIKVKLVKSLIGSKKDQIATAQALGLRKIGDESVQPDNDADQRQGGQDRPPRRGSRSVSKQARRCE